MTENHKASHLAQTFNITTFKEKWSFKKGVNYGIEKGIDQGVQQGIDIGIEKGILKGHKEVAKNLLKAGVELSFILKVTSVSPEEIKK